jgi:hypothetical protein
MDYLTLCSMMKVEFWTRKRDMGYEAENDVVDISGYEKSGLQVTGLGLEIFIAV